MYFVIIMIETLEVMALPVSLYATILIHESSREVP